MNNEQTIVDPFAEINLGDFKTETNVIIEKISKEKIRKVSEKHDFLSREALPIKAKTIAKTFSLFPAEREIIKTALKACMEEDNETTLSGSDVVRSALQAFAKKPMREQIELIQKSRGRLKIK